jgi:hypothetical protein
LVGERSNARLEVCPAAGSLCPLQPVTTGAFTLLAIISLCYAVSIYLYRSQAIRTRRVASYYDKLGPSVLCGALFVAVALNFVFEGKSRGLR